MKRFEVWATLGNRVFDSDGVPLDIEKTDVDIVVVAEDEQGAREEFREWAAWEGEPADTVDIWRVKPL